MALLFSVTRVHSFLLRPSSSPQCVLRAMPSTTPIGSDTGTTAVGEGASPGLPSTEQKSQLSICNNEEGYSLNGILTVKDEESKSLWVLCHGLCSSCEGTVPRFVADLLNANTFRQAPLWPAPVTSSYLDFVGFDSPRYLTQTAVTSDKRKAQETKVQLHPVSCSCVR